MSLLDSTNDGANANLNIFDYLSKLQNGEHERVENSESDSDDDFYVPTGQYQKFFRADKQR